MDLANLYTLRLLQFDKDQREIDRKLLAYEVCKMAFGTGETKTGQHPLLKSDPFADENTQVW